MTVTSVTALPDGTLIILAKGKSVYIKLTDNEALVLKRQINKAIADRERSE